MSLIAATLDRWVAPERRTMAVACGAHVLLLSRGRRLPGWRVLDWTSSNIGTRGRSEIS